METGSIARSEVTVQMISALTDDEQRSFDNISAADQAAVQEKLNANPSLVSSLRAQGVQLKNVAKVIEFPNGSALVYQR